MMKDKVTADERVNIVADPILFDYAGYECTGCGRTSEQIAVEDGWTDDDFDCCSSETDSGLWYCNRDCYRDSR